MGARHFGVGEEVTWGTAVAPTRFFEALSESVQVEREFETVETIRSNSARDLVELTSAVRGDVELIANYEELGLLFKHLMGSIETNGTYTHTAPDSQGIPSVDRVGLGLTLEFRRDDSLSWRYAGGKIISMSHTFGVDQSSRVTFGFLAKNEALAGPVNTTDGSFETLAPMFPKHVDVQLSGTSLCARSVTIDVENPLDETICLGTSGLSREPDRSGILKVTGSMEVIFENTSDFYQYFDGATNVPIVITATGDSPRVLTYDMQQCRITQATPHMTGRERLVATIEFESIFNNASSENLQITLTNNRATP